MEIMIINDVRHKIRDRIWVGYQQTNRKKHSIAGIVLVRIDLINSIEGILDRIIVKEGQPLGLFVMTHE